MADNSEEYDAFWCFVLGNKILLIFVLWNLFWVCLWIEDAYSMYCNFEHWGGDWGGLFYRTREMYVLRSMINVVLFLVPSAIGVRMRLRRNKNYWLVLALPTVYLAGNMLYWRFWGNL